MLCHINLEFIYLKRYANFGLRNTYTLFSLHTRSGNLTWPSESYFLKTVPTAVLIVSVSQLGTLLTGDWLRQLAPQSVSILDFFLLFHKLAPQISVVCEKSIIDISKASYDGITKQQWFWQLRTSQRAPRAPKTLRGKWAKLLDDA